MSIALAKSPFPNITPQELAQQVAGLQKTRQKLPTWSKTPGVYYPPAVSLEQSSSEITAQYKSGLVSGERLLDVTGGFGVDSYYFARRIGEVTYCETDTALAEIAAHNFRVLGQPGIRVHPGDGLAYLRELAARGPRPDWVYADPSRRHARKGRVIRLGDYAPDIPSNLEFILGNCGDLMLKTSPMLDLTSGLASLRHVRAIHVVAVGNEVKELLWLLRHGHRAEAKIIATDLEGSEPPFGFTMTEESKAESTYGGPQEYLYEPHAALLKAGAFRLTGSRYGLLKLHKNTHLYTASTLIPFPGRRFRIRGVQAYKPGKLGFSSGHVNSRNFPEDVATIRRRNRIKSGGDSYLFFVRTPDDSLKVIEAHAV